MKCPSCGNDNKESSKFCFKCGFKLAVPVPPPVFNIPASQETAPVSPSMVPAAEDLSTKPLAAASLLFKDSGMELTIPYKPVVYIGREDRKTGHIPDVDLSEIDKGKVTSRKHAYISYSDGKYKIADQGSLNGTFINSTKLEKNIEYDLKNGDEIILGKLVCIFNCTC